MHKILRCSLHVQGVSSELSFTISSENVEHRKLLRGVQIAIGLVIDPNKIPLWAIEPPFMRVLSESHAFSELLQSFMLTDCVVDMYSKAILAPIPAQAGKYICVYIQKIDNEAHVRAVRVMLNKFDAFDSSKSNGNKFLSTSSQKLAGFKRVARQTELDKEMERQCERQTSQDVRDQQFHKAVTAGLRIRGVPQSSGEYNALYRQVLSTAKFAFRKANEVESQELQITVDSLLNILL
ncbi:hypothetical protein CANCADRAFT_147950 [Tortispora caseinolytica NRRL Y-17796]|uniref:Sld7 C-terminal domain-containing protein n=1 Tax=Tortispora caseinolytica NRRL Y-17796 TaxID=767744 RepID=A0A1E4TET6_9ASCO|nr:hypothetical protein CANCADRAFT_147950 [Tortispora caseinolytica NRRL Y-17796]